ncbi:hypothetical protein GlitD10_1382 [Gloeomargarita lithophora Alchichica-D10]|uniref:DUF948 domain-containing protein n=1 Tax=Gloeomargarita lithophora Alchichica-D10 TaxID=1188229 RepID=A0A1J0ACQ9_9CYAN|nr:hypothetical protein [Gloeomargarita lithophora]APB33703.1 hypothetical protein GlitD10_1382 [Gloeomargarita lithophora Alchichica-D10]
MAEAVFVLGLSLLLVAVSLTAVLIALIPAVQEIARAARSIDKLADTLSRDLPPTLDALRLTGMEISDLTDDVSQGVQSANRIVEQVNQSVQGTRQTVRRTQASTRSVWVGVKAAWNTWKRPEPPPYRLPPERQSLPQPESPPE